jgi:hypothetical protein
MEDIITLDKETDLVWSPDDGAWYLQLYIDKKGNTKTSPFYSTKDGAIRAWRHGNIVWD